MALTWDELVKRRAMALNQLEVLRKCSDEQVARVMEWAIEGFPTDWKQEAKRQGWTEDDIAAVAEGRSVAAMVKAFEKSLASFEREIAARS